MNLQFPGTTTPTGPAYVNPDTVIIADAKKTYGDNSPREIFKWPIKFVADGANNTKRAEPNLRYEWQVRCECGHSGEGIESPWSDIKIFNTPDFDPTTGIYTAPGQVGNSDELKLLAPVSALDVNLYPNPNNGDFTLDIEGARELTFLDLNLRNMQGQLIKSRNIQLQKGNVTIHWQTETDLPTGLYMIELRTKQASVTKSFSVIH